MKNLCKTRLAATSFFLLFFYVVCSFPSDLGVIIIMSSINTWHLEWGGSLLLTLFTFPYRSGKFLGLLLYYYFFFSFVRSFLLTCLFYFFFSFVSLYSNRCFPFFSPSIASLRSIPHMTDQSFVFLHYPQTFSINKPTGLSFTFAHLRSHPIISSTVSFSNTLQHTPPTPYHIVVRVSSVPSSASAVIN